MFVYLVLIHNSAMDPGHWESDVVFSDLEKAKEWARAHCTREDDSCTVLRFELDRSSTRQYVWSCYVQYNGELVEEGEV